MTVDQKVAAIMQPLRSGADFPAEGAAVAELLLRELFLGLEAVQVIARLVEQLAAAKGAGQ